jgi:hypothetical protein
MGLKSSMTKALSWPNAHTQEKTSILRGPRATRAALRERPKTEAAARVWGAIRILEAVGFLDRAVMSGSTHRPTITGELHRKPILFQFGGEYASSFGLANKRAQKDRERHSCARRSPPTPAAPSRVSTAFPASSALSEQVPRCLSLRAGAPPFSRGFGTNRPDARSAPVKRDRDGVRKSGRTRTRGCVRRWARDLGRRRSGRGCALVIRRVRRIPG